MSRSLFADFVREIRQALQLRHPNLHPLPYKLGDIAAELDELEEALQELHDAADEPAIVTSILRLVSAIHGFPQNIDFSWDELLIRWLQATRPRIAAAFSLLGIVRYSFHSSGSRTVAQINWNRLGRLVTQPQNLAGGASLWDEIGLTDSASQSEDERLAATLFAALILAPQAVWSIVGNGLKVRPLPPPTVRTPGWWQTFRNTTANWFSVTIPLPIKGTSNPPRPRTVFDWAPQLEPDASFTLALRSYRRQIGNDLVGHMEIWLAAFLGTQQWTVPLGNKGWQVQIDTGLGESPVLGALFRTDGVWCWPDSLHLATPQPVAPPPGGVPANSIRFTFGKQLKEGERLVVIGPPEGIHLQIANIEFGVQMTISNNPQTPLFRLFARLDDFGIVANSGFLGVLGDGIVGGDAGFRLTADLDLSFEHNTGFRANVTDVDAAATLGLHGVYPIDYQLGGEGLNVQLKKLLFKVPLDLQGPSLRAEALLTTEADLGPVHLTLEEAGSWLGYDPSKPDGADQHIGVIPPRGMGISIDAGPVTGGGFLRHESLGMVERYLGALNLQISEIGVSAYGIYESRPGYKSFIAVMGARFPGIQLGFGVELNGLGGLVGLNRRSDTDLLREKLASGASGEVLFTDDPVSNAPTLLADLDALFPSTQGVFIAGPSVKLGWLLFMRFDLAVLIEFPGPSKVTILGRMRGELAAPLLQLQLEVLGVIDFVKKVVQIDATLVNSKLLEIFQLSGDAAFRLSWGSQPYMLLSIGGFHPEYNPSPVAFPPLERVAMSYEVGSSVKLWLRLEGYLAITSNTFQVGARVEAGIKAGPLRAEGFIAFDALIQFRPFYFTIDFAAGFKIAFDGVRLASLKVRGTLAGPGPLKLRAQFSFEILFIEVSFKKTFKLGSSAGDTISPVTDLLQQLEAELSAPTNVEAVGGTDREVITRIEKAQQAVISPLGRLSWAQRRVPFDLTLERFGGVPLANPTEVRLQSDQAVSEEVKDWFSPGSFRELNASEALNQSAFVRLESGAIFGFGEEQPTTPELRPVEPDTFRITPEGEAQAVTLTGSAIPLAVQASVEGRDAAAGVYAAAPVIVVSESTWTHHSADGTLNSDQLNEASAHQRVSSDGGMALPLEDELVEIPA